MSEVMKPLHMDELMDNTVITLSGGEMQRVAIVLCLGQPAGHRRRLLPAPAFALCPAIGS